MKKSLEWNTFLLSPGQSGCSINLSWIKNCTRSLQMSNSNRITSSYFMPRNGSNIFYHKLTPCLVSPCSAMEQQAILDSAIPFIPSFINNRVCQFCPLNASIAQCTAHRPLGFPKTLSEVPQGQNAILGGYSCFHSLVICTLYKSNGG